MTPEHPLERGTDSPVERGDEAERLRSILEQAVHELRDYRDNPTDPHKIEQVCDFVEAATAALSAPTPPEQPERRCEECGSNRVQPDGSGHWKSCSLAADPALNQEGERLLDLLKRTEDTIRECHEKAEKMERRDKREPPGLQLSIYQYRMPVGPWHRLLALASHLCAARGELLAERSREAEQVVVSPLTIEEAYALRQTETRKTNPPSIGGEHLASARLKVAQGISEWERRAALSNAAEADRG